MLSTVGSASCRDMRKAQSFQRLDEHFEEVITKLLDLENENEDDDEYEKRRNVV